MDNQGGSRVTVIAEAGVNHNGSLEMAERMIRLAAEAGADAVKFQTFRPELGVCRHARKAEYQEVTTGAEESQLEMVKRYVLDEAAHRRLADVCAHAGVEFLSTPFDPPSVDLLVGLGVRRLKVPSGEITNASLLYRIARTGLPLIVSTGMSTLEEVRRALGVIALGAAFPEMSPSLERAEWAYSQAVARRLLEERVTLLHCTTQYPAPPGDVNLRCMDSLREAFALPVGYSDHTAGVEASLAAAARGAVAVEKHFTLDCSLPGPDHRASADPDELRELIAGIRRVEVLLGSPRKQAAPSERSNRDVARKSLVALRPIAAGELFTEDNLGTKRPGTGVSAWRYWEYLGKAAGRNYDTDEMIGGGCGGGIQ